MFQWFRNRGRHKRFVRLQSTLQENSLYLEDLYLQYFSDMDESRFKLLWCEIAEILGVPVRELRPEMHWRGCLTQNRPSWWQNTPQEELEYLIGMESRGRPPPAEELLTIEDVLHYLR